MLTLGKKYKEKERKRNQKTKPKIVGGTHKFTACAFEKVNLKPFFGNTSLIVSQCIDFDSDKILHLFHSLGLGSTGDCCLAMSERKETKCFCVVTFFFEPRTAKEAASMPSNDDILIEYNNWNTIYDDLSQYTYHGQFGSTEF